MKFSSKLLIVTLLQYIVQPIPFSCCYASDIYCDPFFKEDDFDVTNVCGNFQAVGQLLVEGSHFPSAKVPYVSFASSHIFGKDDNQNYYGSTCAHVIEKFLYFKEKSPNIKLYLSLNNNPAQSLLEMNQYIIHPNYDVEPDYRYDIAIIKFNVFNNLHPTISPVPLYLRDDFLPEDEEIFQAVGYGSKGWIGGNLSKFNQSKHRVNICFSKPFTDSLTDSISTRYFKVLEKSWLFPLGMKVKNEQDFKVRDLYPLEGGFNNGMSGGTAFQGNDNFLKARAMLTGVIHYESLGDYSVSDEEKLELLIHGRLSGDPIKGINPVRGQTDLIVPYYIWKDFFVKSLNDWKVPDELQNNFFVM